MIDPIVETGPMRRAADRQLEEELEVLARWMDSVFEIPGLRIRFGLDSLIGLIPGLGDTLTSLVSLYILGAANRFGVPRVTLVRMAMNIAIDWTLGSLPIVGDVFDVYWKSNLKNVALLRRHLKASPADERRARAGDWWFVGGLMFGLIALLAVCLVIVYFVVVWLADLIFVRPR